MSDGECPSSAAELDEMSMRADEGKLRRYQRLLDGPHFTAVLEANRAYIAAAIPDPAATERDYWALSCLPGKGVLSRISMAGMETFVITAPDRDGTGDVSGFVQVRTSILEAQCGSIAAFKANFPDLDLSPTDYRDGGEDQARVSGVHQSLVQALWTEHVGEAARALAQSLMRKTTVYRRAHSYMLADHVLGRV